MIKKIKQRDAKKNKRLKSQIESKPIHSLRP